MKTNRSIWELTSDDLTTVAERVREGLVHIGGDAVANRTGVVIGTDRIATIARQAEDGENVPVLDVRGETRPARVLGFEPRSGLCLLQVQEAFPDAAVLSACAAVPRLGELVLTLAYPSPEGPEARLDLIRCLGRSEAGELSYLQTDGQGFPGFLGAPVLRSDGTVHGLISMNGQGNRSLVLPARQLWEQAESLAAAGSPRHAYLGVQTRPVRLSPAQAELLAAGTGHGAAEARDAAALLITEVEAEGPAGQAGLQSGDILAAAEGVRLLDPRDLLQVLRRHRSEAEINLAVIRGERALPLAVKPQLRVAGRWRRR
ncbi:MAG: serine protease [Spirochaetales bacterium]|nr:serine protease [Spirochaetales bacterium]